ncbi:AURKA [Symbiodinium sp. CCMP2456]|nr:AURKA [Symbiodinium sp. CCMP2456]
MALTPLLLAAVFAASRSFRLDADSNFEGGIDTKREWPWTRRLTVDEAAIERWRRDGGDLPTSSSALLEASGNASRAPPLPPAWSKRLTFLRALGSGGHGTAYLYVVSCGSSNITVTVKLLHNKRLQDMREVRAMRAMYGVSDFCISTLGAPDYIDTESGLWIMMPFLNSGSLLQLLEKLENCPAKCRCNSRICWERLGAPYSIPFVQALLYQAALGVGALHSQGYHHMDLKPENIMLNCRGTNCFAEVIDLGIACHPKLCKWSGTIGFIAPEVWTGTGLGLAANDVWSLGVVFYEMMYGRKPPFHGDRNGRETRSYIPTIDDAIPKPRMPIDHLIENMLSHNPSRRPTMSGLKDRLRRIILNSDPGQDVLDMINMSPLERGAQQKLPPCLLQYEDPEHVRDIGDRPAHRMDCASPPRYAQGYFRCGVCASCNPCCKCNVKRKDKLEKAYFRMSTCE